MTRLRSTVLAVIAAFTVMLLAACAQIPMSGAVQEGTPQDEAHEQGVRYYPAGPIAGASLEEIVQGFIEAGTGLQNDYAVARTYLAGDAAAEWDPDSRVLISDGQTSMRTEPGNQISVSVSVYGHVDERGVYIESLASTAQTLEFRLQSFEGEWRIVEAPDGIVLIQQAFADLFEPQPLTFFDGAQKFTTVDLRWFPDDASLATRAVEELLDGPAPWLLPGDSVTSSFPNGTELLSSVRTTGSTATINFSEALSSAQPGALSLMKLQLESTLTALPEITSVEMQINGARLDATLPAPDEVVTRADVNPSPLVQQGADMGYLSGGSLTPPVGSENVVAEVQRLEPIRGTLSAMRGTVSLLAEEGTYAMTYEDEQARLIDSREGQVEPALDNWDWVWTQSTTDTGLRVTQIGSYESYEIALPPAVAANFVSHQVSRDGTKMAFLYDTNEGVKLAIAPIVRSDGAPTYLGPPLVMSLLGERPNDVAWVDANAVALLVDNGEGTTDVRLYRITGEFTVLGSIPGAMQTAGSNTLSGMRVVDRQGTLYAPRGTRWQASETVVTFLYAQM